MPSITRVNGFAQPGSQYGLTPRYLKVDTGNISFETGNANASDYYLKPESPFDKAVFAVGTEASIITLGTPSGNAFVVQVDNTYGGSTGNNTVSTMAASIQDALGANLVTITESTGFVGAAFNTFS